MTSSPQTRLIGKRPPSIAGETPSMTTRLRPSGSSIVHTPSDGDDMMGALEMPRKGQHMIFFRARDRQRLVGSLLEEIPVLTAEIQRLIGDIELDSPISAPCDQFADQRCEVLRLPLLKFIEHRHTGTKIHR